jgi:integrase/recombinase XerD
MMTVLIQHFENYLYQVGYGKHTQKSLPVLVKEFIEQQSITDISCVEQQQVQSFYAYLQMRPLKRRSGALSEAMISQYMYGIKTFFNWLEVTGQTGYNPISGIKFRRPSYAKREPLSIEQINQLFEATTTLKQRAMLHLFYSCGLRRTEAELLNSSDIHFRQQLLYVREGKGCKRRVVPMTERVTRELESYYLNERCSAKAIKAKDMDAFILTERGERMMGYTYRLKLKAIIKRSSLVDQPFAASITLHHLRHSIATHLLQSGMSMEYVKDFLGHGYLKTTHIYAKPHATQLRLL